MKFAIIMPTYKRAERLERAIRSVQAQSYEDWILVIADDGSGDETRATLEKYVSLDDRIHALSEEENQGVNAARNRALEYILDLDVALVVTLLDDDDEFTQDALANAAKQLYNYPSEFWYITGCKINTNKPTKLGKFGKIDYVNDYLCGKAIRGDVTHFIRTSVIGETRFSRILRQGEEWIFFLGLAISYQPFVYDDIATVKEYQETGLLASRPHADQGLEIGRELLRLALILRPWNLRARRRYWKICCQTSRTLKLDVKAKDGTLLGYD